MVAPSAVFSVQYSVFRKFVAISELPKSPMGALKQIFFLLVFLNTEYWTLSTAQAKSLGVHGVIASIEEADPIALIQQKLKVMEGSGELKKRNLELQKKTRASVERPKPVDGIAKAPKGRIFYYDPTYVVREDLKDHQGRIFAKKGTRLNPLETVRLSTNLLFFDGDDEEQLDWVKKQLVKSTEINPIRLILTQGTPLTLAEELKNPVYFDQGGILSKKLGIRYVPAVVSQEILRLRIEEIELPPSKELLIEEGT